MHNICVFIIYSFTRVIYTTREYIMHTSYYSKNSDVPRAARSSADFRAAEIGPIDGRAAACAERTGERRKEKGIEAHIDGASTLSHPISSRISPTIPGRGAAAPPSREAA